MREHSFSPFLCLLAVHRRYMAIISITDLGVRKIKLPKEGIALYYDKKLRGFALRCSKGSKTFVLFAGKKRQLTTIGRYPIITVQKARERAEELLAERTLGTIRPPTIQFQKAKALFIEACKAKNKARTVYDYERLLKAHFSKLDLRPLDSVQTYEIGDILSALKKTPTESVHAFTTIRAFFRFCRKRGLILRNPIEGMEPPARTESRERVLADKELSEIYSKAGECGTFGTIVRLLILTGQRRGEIAALRAEYFDTKEQTITFPKTATKNGREHTLPYGVMLAELIKLPEQGLLFPARGKPDKPVNGWGKAKQCLDEKLEGVQPWTLHDLRRTFSTNLAGLAVAPHVIEKLLNHATGTIQGIAAIYNRYRFMDEMRAAIKAWETKLTDILKAA